MKPEFINIIAPGAKNTKELVTELNAQLPNSDINNPIRLAAFLTHTAFRTEDYFNLSRGLLALSDENIARYGNPITDMRTAVDSAVWFWEVSKLSKIADTEDQKALLVAINGLEVASRIPHWDIQSAYKLNLIAISFARL